jgi:hypothetical protein
MFNKLFGRRELYISELKEEIEEMIEYGNER